jgi:hypothetical protein
MRACGAPMPNLGWYRTPEHALVCFTTGVPRLARIACLDPPIQVQQGGWNVCSGGQQACHARSGADAGPGVVCGGAARLGQPDTQERVCVRGRWCATLCVPARDAPPTDALTTPLAGSPSWSIRRSLGAPPASMGAPGVITARQQLAGRTVIAHAVLTRAHTSASSRAGHLPWRPSSRARVPCAHPRHQKNARASYDSFRAPFRVKIDEKTHAENQQQMREPATRLLAGAAEDYCVHAPAGPGTPAAVATAGHRASSTLNGGQALEFLAGLLPDSPSRALAHRWSHPGPDLACLPGPLSAKTRVTCRRRSVGRPAPMARE